MSKKWQRNKAWENEHLVGRLTPVRVVLRIFSSIPTAIVLLLFVAFYAMLASVPIGMMARVPTLLLDAAMFVVLVALPVLPTLYFARRALVDKTATVRFLILFGVVVAMGGLMAIVWAVVIWPRLSYGSDGSGFMLFRGFVERYKSTTLRRLPGFELTETQFYAWWPLRLALVLFVINLIVATIRRIEFNVKNMGVLMVHTGIVTIALGSVFYQKFKLEGDTLLPAGTESMPGPAQRAFYDRQAVALYVAQARGPSTQPQFEQRPLMHLPLYNAYGLDAGIPEGTSTLSAEMGRELAPNDEGRTLDQPVPNGTGTLVDHDIRFRVVGFSPYATLDNDWYKAPPPVNAPTNPYRLINLHFTRGATTGALPPGDPIFNFRFFLNEPANRVRFNDLMAIEYTRSMSDQRWDDLTTELGGEFQNALVIEVPGQGFKAVIPVRKGNRVSLGSTGWTLEVEDLAAEPPFPIITPGYENATSSMAIVHLTKPAVGDQPARDISRWVFHRYPELNQDLSPGADGRPVRTAPDPALRVSYIDATKLQIYLDEHKDEDGSERIRAIVRQPTGAVRVIDHLDAGWLIDVIPNEQHDRLDLHLADSWEHAQRISRPIPTPDREQDKSLIGSYTNAFVGVEISLEQTQTHDAWSRVVWLPFSQYVTLQADKRNQITLPDGRSIMLVFGRYQRPLPGFELSLVNFEMIAYDHRGAPRDYQSVVRVSPNPFYPGPKPDFEGFDHVIKLNNPLRAPYHWDPERSWLTNTLVRLGAGMNPNQFKLSQSGWDRSGWQQSQKLVDQGVLDKPKANFTILGVGNNPGIHIIALGAIFMSVGIPWAFYFKPYLVKREKRRLADLHAKPRASLGEQSADSPAPLAQPRAPRPPIKEAAT